jgi:hypothetical protein
LKLPSKEYIKLKALTAEGIAINSVVKNTEPKNGFIPETNI